MKPHSVHPGVAQEYADAATFYSRITAELGGRFHDEIERLIRDVRCQPDRVWIVAVMHLKRRPGYWKRRLD